MFFVDLDKPNPDEIKNWMKINNLTVNSAARKLGISKRQFSRFLSGETSAKRIHTLAMQMIWLIIENKKMDRHENYVEKKDQRKVKKISIPIK